MSIEDRIKRVFKISWNVFKDKFVTLIIATLVAFLLMIFIVTIPPLFYGLYYMCSQMIKGKKVELSDMFYGFNYFFRSWGLFLLLLIGIAAGLIAFIIPGIFLIIVWQYAFAVSASEDKRIIESMKKSWDLGINNFSFSLVFAVLVWIIGALGSVTKVGMLVTIPFTILMAIVAVQVLDSKNAKKKAKKKKKK